MNRYSSSTLVTALVLASALSACKGPQTPEAVAPAATPATTASTPAAAMPAPAEAGAMPAAEAPMAIPATADAIWQEIDKHNAELKATIASGKLGEVHHHAFAIRDLVAALPSHTPSLPSDEQKKLDGEVKFVNTLADRLDQSGDAADLPATQASYDQLGKVLTGITRYK